MRSVNSHKYFYLPAQASHTIIMSYNGAVMIKISDVYFTGH